MVRIGCRPETWLRFCREENQRSKFLVDTLSKDKRISGFFDPYELLDFLLIGLLAFQDALEGGAGLIITADDFGTLMNFFKELHRRLEEVIHNA